MWKWLVRGLGNGILSMRMSTHVGGILLCHPCSCCFRSVTVVWWRALSSTGIYRTHDLGTEGINHGNQDLSSQLKAENWLLHLSSPYTSFDCFTWPVFPRKHPKHLSRKVSLLIRVNQASQEAGVWFYHIQEEELGLMGIQTVSVAKHFFLIQQTFSRLFYP